MIDSLARYLPTSRVLEPCMRYVNAYIQSNDPLQRKAAFGALTVLARGCCDVLVEHAEQLVPYVLFTCTHTSSLHSSVFCLLISVVCFCFLQRQSTLFYEFDARFHFEFWFGVVIQRIHWSQCWSTTHRLSHTWTICRFSLFCFHSFTPSLEHNLIRTFYLLLRIYPWHSQLSWNDTSFTVESDDGIWWGSSGTCLLFACCICWKSWCVCEVFWNFNMWTELFVDWELDVV